MSGDNGQTQREQIQDALYDWIEAVLTENSCSCPIVWDNSPGPRPEPPFISLQMIGGSRGSFPWKSRVDTESGERTVRHDMRKTVSINGWGESCMERLDEIADSISAENYRRMLKRSGLIVTPITDVSGTGEDRANGTETHAFFDIAVTYIRIVKEKSGWIESVNIQSDMPANPEIDINAGGA
ncbi:MAG: hypothetical protein J5747_00545 [Spirochaetaceae bacterium]|nr:hypothetical protein [Spirochaetaceae bacterium]